MSILLDFKRCVVTFGSKGNPDGGRLQTIRIPKAVLNVAVPNVVGQTFDAATATLHAANLGIRDWGDTSQVATNQSPVATTLVAPEFVVNVLFGE